MPCSLFTLYEIQVLQLRRCWQFSAPMVSARRLFYSVRRSMFSSSDGFSKRVVHRWNVILMFCLYWTILVCIEGLGEILNKIWNHRSNTVCPSSLSPFNKVRHYTNWPRLLGHKYKLGILSHPWYERCSEGTLGRRMDDVQQGLQTSVVHSHVCILTELYWLYILISLGNESLRANWSLHKINNFNQNQRN